MSENTISRHARQMFAKNFEHLVQQKDSRFYNVFPTAIQAKGEAAQVVDQYGLTEAKINTERKGDTPDIEVPRQAVWVYPEEWEWGTMIPKKDMTDTAISDLQSPLLQAGTQGMMRLFDRDIAVPKFFGSMRVGKFGADTQAFPTTSQDVDVQFDGQGGSTDLGMNVAKLERAQEIWLASEVDFDEEEIYIATAARQMRELRDDPKFSSKDYVDRTIYRTKINKAGSGTLEFIFIHSEKLPIVGGHRQCPCWTKSGMVKAVWNEMSVNIAPRPDKKFVPHIYLHQNVGVTRTQDQKVVRIQCQE